MKVSRFIYRSFSSPGLNKDQLKVILRTSQENNRKRNITGALCIDENCFIQLLEGPHDSLNDLIQHLFVDARHRDFEIIEYALDQERYFQKWAMLALGHDPQTQNLIKACTGESGIRPKNMQASHIPAFISRLAKACSKADIATNI